MYLMNPIVLEACVAQCVHTESVTLYSRNAKALFSGPLVCFLSKGFEPA